MNCLIFYPQKPNVLEFLPQLNDILEKLKLEAEFHIIPLSLEFTDEEITKIQKNLTKANFIISLGGDGSVLSTAKIIYPSSVPILAINFGHLGFIAEILPQDTEIILNNVIKNQVQIEKRILMQVTHRRSQQTFVIVNEAFVGSNPLHKIGEFQISINGKIVAQYLADGVIVATPIGSTGYSLSAGGSILSPHLDNFIFVPVCPHTLTSRSLVMSADNDIEIQVTNQYSQNLFLDGQIKNELKKGDIILIKKAPHHFNLMYPQERNYYTTLQEKLNWLV